MLDAAKSDSVTDALLHEIEAKLRAADVAYLSREIPQAIEQSLEGVQHVAHIVGTMKEFAHPSSGQKQPIDLNHALEGALTLSRGEWKYVADLVTDFDPELPPVHCMPTDIHRMMTNLIVNAAQAIAEKPRGAAQSKDTITVRTRYEHPWVEIRVEDTGTGIPEEVRPRVFDLFFTTKEIGLGTGQGLALVHAIVVERHGGTIRLETEVGVGTTFIIRLPVGDPAEPCAAAVRPARVRVEGSVSDAQCGPRTLKNELLNPNR